MTWHYSVSKTMQTATDAIFTSLPQLIINSCSLFSCHILHKYCNKFISNVFTIKFTRQMISSSIHGLHGVVKCFLTWLEWRTYPVLDPAARLFFFFLKSIMHPFHSTRSFTITQLVPSQCRRGLMRFSGLLIVRSVNGYLPPTCETKHVPGVVGKVSKKP